MTPTPEGTRRRIRALFARGWSDLSIEERTGIPAVKIVRALGDKRSITPEFCGEISAAYEALWNRPPPRETPEQAAEAEAARRHAERWGWPPPMALDDDEVDKPDYQLTTRAWKRSNRTTVPTAGLAEDVAWVREQGGYRHASNTEIAMRLGVPREVLEKALKRSEPQHRQADTEAEAS